MTQKFHLTEKGPMPCKAFVKDCPIDGIHGTLEKVTREYELKLESEFSSNLKDKNKKQLIPVVVSDFDERVELLKNVLSSVEVNENEVILLTGQHKSLLESFGREGKVIPDNSRTVYDDVNVKKMYSEVQQNNNDAGMFFTFKVNVDTVEDLYEDYGDIYFEEDVDLYVLKVNKKDVLHTSYHHEWSEAISDESGSLDDLTITSVDSEIGSGYDLQVILKEINNDQIVKIISMD